MEKGLEIACYVDSSVPVLAQSDPARLRQVQPAALPPATPSRTQAAGLSD